MKDCIPIFNALVLPYNKVKRMLLFNIIKNIRKMYLLLFGDKICTECYILLLIWHARKYKEKNKILSKTIQS